MKPPHIPDARFGIGAASRVVVYSSAQPGWAVRLWRLLLGLDDTRVYDGSLMEWAQDPARPLVP
ncbi:hypothetical protein [Ketogulonicigenium vulgare]|uniref:hypothetical protein n=1 Tax=Ketogulonicigenium vulgare TaxID=92945 RepID=UPI002359C27D|nr:hypothetical protein [Ketogulonicigenium vulgare]